MLLTHYLNFCTDYRLRQYFAKTMTPYVTKRNEKVMEKQLNSELITWLEKNDEPGTITTVARLKKALRWTIMITVSHKSKIYQWLIHSFIHESKWALGATADWPHCKSSTIEETTLRDLQEFPVSQNHISQLFTILMCILYAEFYGFSIVCRIFEKSETNLNLSLLNLGHVRKLLLNAVMVLFCEKLILITAKIHIKTFLLDFKALVWNVWLNFLLLRVFVADISLCALIYILLFIIEYL